MDDKEAAFQKEIRRLKDEIGRLRTVIPPGTFVP